MPQSEEINSAFPSGHFEVCAECGAPVGSAPKEWQDPTQTTWLSVFWCYRCKDTVPTLKTKNPNWAWAPGEGGKRPSIYRDCMACGGTGKPPPEFEDRPCLCMGKGFFVLKKTTGEKDV